MFIFLSLKTFVFQGTESRTAIKMPIKKQNKHQNQKNNKKPWKRTVLCVTLFCFVQKMSGKEPLKPLMVITSSYFPSPAWFHACCGSCWWGHFGRRIFSHPQPFLSASLLLDRYVVFLCSLTRLKWFWSFTLTQITSDYISQGWGKVRSGVMWPFV